MTIWHLDVVLLALIAWRFQADRFASLDQFADRVADALPDFLTEARWGDPASWVLHAVWTACIGAIGGLLSWLLLGSFALGFAHWVVCGFVFYVVREAEQAWWASKQNSRRGPIIDKRDHARGFHVGWLADGIMDLVGPAIVVWQFGPFRGLLGG